MVQEGLRNEGTESENFDKDVASEVSGDDEFVQTTEPNPLVVESREVTPAIRAALAELDTIHLVVEFSQRASVMKTVPHFLRGPFRSAMRLALEEVNKFNVNRRERGWKLFMLLPHLLLFRPRRGGNIHKSKLAQRFQDFAEGRWMSLLRVSRQCTEDASREQEAPETQD